MYSVSRRAKLTAWGVFACVSVMIIGAILMTDMFTPSVADPNPVFIPLRIETQSDKHYDFLVELADTQDERALGLMHRTELAKDKGMFFDFQRDLVVNMWMKNTNIPLDMVFIDKDGRINSIAKRAIPHSEAIISSNRRVRYVLEIVGGLSDELGLQVGDQVNWTAPQEKTK